MSNSPVQAILEAMDGIAILIDQSLTIRRIGVRNWKEFWSKNGGAAAEAIPIGLDITSFFSAGEVRDTYRDLFRQVLRGKRRQVRIDYRCDSAVAKRTMRLCVTHLPEAEEQDFILLYQSTILSQEQRPAIPLFGASTAGSERIDLVKICSICARVQWPAKDDRPQSEWMEPQEYYRRGGEDVVLMSHGFCTPCYEKVLAEDT
jgi:hypothetical protein